MTIDSQFSSTSENALQNKVITNELYNIYSGLRNINVGDTEHTFRRSYAKYGVSIDDIIGEIDNNGVLQQPTPSEIIVEGLVNMKGGGGQYSNLFKKWSDNPNVTSIAFPDLEIIGSSGDFQGSFSNMPNLTNVSFPKLHTIQGTYGFRFAFSGCTSLTTLSFPALANIQSTNSNSGMFHQCLMGATSFESIYFPALNTNSFGTDGYCGQFMYLYFNGGPSSVTLHFPSNLESMLSGKLNYLGNDPVILFDLPATS